MKSAPHTDGLVRASDGLCVPSVQNVVSLAKHGCEMHIQDESRHHWSDEAAGPGQGRAGYRA